MRKVGEKLLKKCILIIFETVISVKIKKNEFAYYYYEFVFSLYCLLDQTGDFTRCVLNNSDVRLCIRSITFGDFTRCVLYTLLLDCVPGRSLLVISPDVFSIILL